MLTGFSDGRYISDLHIGGAQSAQVRLFAVLLSAFVRGRVSLHYGSSADAQASLERCRVQVGPYVIALASLRRRSGDRGSETCAYN